MKDITLNESDLNFINRFLDEIIQAGPEGEKLAKEKSDGSYAFSFGYVSAATKSSAEIIQDFLKEKGGLK